MFTVAVPNHLDDRLEGFDLGLPVDAEVRVELPEGERWQRMAALYEQIADAIAAAATNPAAPPLVLSGDCTTRSPV